MFIPLLNSKLIIRSEKTIMNPIIVPEIIPFFLEFLAILKDKIPKNIRYDINNIFEIALYDILLK